MRVGGPVVVVTLRRVVGGEVGLGRVVAVDSGPVVVAGALVVWVVTGWVVVGASVTSEVTIEVTVTVRVCCPVALAVPTAAPSTNPAMASTQPRRHHGGPSGGCGGRGGGGVPQLLGGCCGGACPQPVRSLGLGGIGWVGWSATLGAPLISRPGVAAGRLYGKNRPVRATVTLWS